MKKRERRRPRKGVYLPRRDEDGITRALDKEVSLDAGLRQFLDVKGQEAMRVSVQDASLAGRVRRGRESLRQLSEDMISIQPRQGQDVPEMKLTSSMSSRRKKSQRAAARASSEPASTALVGWEATSTGAAR